MDPQCSARAGNDEIEPALIEGGQELILLSTNPVHTRVELPGERLRRWHLAANRSRRRARTVTAISFVYPEQWAPQGANSVPFLRITIRFFPFRLAGPSRI